MAAGSASAPPPPPISAALHPSEPDARDMDPRDVGCVLHLSRARRGLAEADVRSLLRATGGDVAASFLPWQRLDDCSFLLTFNSPERSKRALAAWEANAARGGGSDAGPTATLRLWGAGAAAILHAAARGGGGGAGREPGPLPVPSAAPAPNRRALAVALPPPPPPHMAGWGVYSLPFDDHAEEDTNWD